MPSDSHRSRLVARKPGAKCKQCQVESARADRQDGLGRNCGDHKDRALAKKAAFDKQEAEKNR